MAAPLPPENLPGVLLPGVLLPGVLLPGVLLRVVLLPPALAVAILARLTIPALAATPARPRSRLRARRWMVEHRPGTRRTT